ncbi:MAG: hypothetical protein MJ236_07495 [Clostridia bacterium]|nr:hypothetical protein [Clostridia bacterium]
MVFNSKRYKLVYENEALLTEDALKIAADFADIFDDAICFAAIGDRHFLVLEYDGNSDVNVLLKLFANTARAALRQQPDFKIMVLDNDMGLVITVGTVFSVVEKSRFNEKTNNISVDVALEYRSDALEACENFKVSAIAIPVNFKRS